jgi:hypothetical protein
MNEIDTTAFNVGATNTRASIQELERAVLAMPQIELEARHYLGGGILARELFMPKDSVVTGKIHIKEHICTIVYGDVTIVDEFGSCRVVGPCTFVGKPGSKRALLMHEDTLWIAYHTTDKNDVDEAIAEIVTNDYEEFDKLAGEEKCLIS